MASGNPYFGDFTDAIRMAIPLTINQRNLEAEAKQKDQALQVMRERMALETLQKAAQLQQEKEKAATELLGKSLETAVAAQDQPTYARVASQLDKLNPQLALGVGDHDRVGYPVPLAKPTKEAKPSSDIEEYNFAIDQAAKGIGKHPGDFTTWLRENKKAGASSVTVGTGDTVKPTPATASEIQKDVVGLRVQISNLADIGRKFEPQFLTYGGRVKEWGLDKAEKAGFKLKPEEEKFVADMNKFKGSVERTFNVYRKEITGAAAAVQELDRLKQSLINMDMGPTQFKAALSSYQKELQRSLRIKNKLLRKGINVKDEKHADDFDEEFYSDGDDDINARGAELKQKYPNKSDAEIAKILMAEGYN